MLSYRVNMPGWNLLKPLLLPVLKRGKVCCDFVPVLLTRLTPYAENVFNSRKHILFSRQRESIDCRWFEIQLDFHCWWFRLSLGLAASVAAQFPVKGNEVRHCYINTARFRTQRGNNNIPLQSYLHFSECRYIMKMFEFSRGINKFKLKDLNTGTVLKVMQTWT